MEETNQISDVDHELQMEVDHKYQNRYWKEVQKRLCISLGGYLEMR